MKDIVATAILTAAASLGCVPFVTMFAEGQRATASEQVTTAVGVVAFLAAAGLTVERGGLAAAVLLLFLTGLVHDTAQRRALSRYVRASCAWVSVALLLSYIGLDRG
ncbi:hypothetical protein [Methylobacterium oryzae]|uniref:Lipoprotein n=1 Tax=Methylobacterium oryzae TaxID=334852 RepID=A0ABU7TRT6_9HYPH